ncbi:MAG: MATE family efflux transporter [Defluviitaleaceae bacterium]|nr:MATE family efflux transporter [Defluviitaleaceae bacterium]
MSKTKYDLTQGPIFKKLLKLSLPIMATSLFQSAYDMTNMFWLSRLGEEYLASAGLANQFIWLSFSLIMLCRIGAEIGVSQNMGKGEPETAKAFAQNGFMLALISGALFSVFLITLRVPLLSLLNIENPYLAEQAALFLGVSALALPLTFGHFVITGIFSGFGNTRVPFIINSVALSLNIGLAPVFIFVLDMGMVGAAVSIIVSNAFNISAKIWAMTKYKDRPFKDFKPFGKIVSGKIGQISRWGVPVALENLLFNFSFMLMTFVIVSFGDFAVSGHQVGMRVESLSFMVGGGFASAITAFIGQNFGAKKWGRVRRTVRVAYIFMGAYGLIIACILFFGAEAFVSLFLEYPESIQIAANYLRILAPAQILFCIEGVAAGSFRGRGLTMKPTIASVSSNVIRIILVFALAATALGIDGVWVAIAIAMTVRSVWLLVWHFINMKKLPKEDEVMDV